MTFTQDQLVLACADAAKAGAEAERASIVKSLEKFLAYAQSLTINKLTVEGIELALEKVKDVPK